MRNSLLIIFIFFSVQINAQFLLSYDKPASPFTEEQRQDCKKKWIDIKSVTFCRNRERVYYNE